MVAVEVWLWLGLIVSTIIAIIITLQSIQLRIFPNRLVEFLWIIVGGFAVTIFFKGFIDYVKSNQVMALVIVILVVFYFVLNPLEIKKVGKKKK